jgi:hypothetical protein
MHWLQYLNQKIIDLVEYSLNHLSVFWIFSFTFFILLVLVLIKIHNNEKLKNDFRMRIRFIYFEFVIYFSYNIFLKLLSFLCLKSNYDYFSLKTHRGGIFLFGLDGAILINLILIISLLNIFQKSLILFYGKIVGLIGIPIGIFGGTFFFIFLFQLPYYFFSFNKIIFGNGIQLLSGFLWVGIYFILFFSFFEYIIFFKKGF